MKPPTLVYFVNSGDTSSQEFFLSPLLESAGVAIEPYPFDQLPDTPADGSKVVFVRYVPNRWRHWVEANRSVLSGVVLFMDDDVLDPDAARGTPWRYRWKLWRLAARHAGWLRRQRAELWVSTAHLQEKYADWPVKTVLPVQSESEEVTWVFYHGSASHRPEINWLREVIEMVMARNQLVRFELIGDYRVRRKWQGLEGVTVVHPMKWPAYLPYSAMQGRHIGLAPLLDLPFNRARSYTKFFDITRSGAVGVYSDHPVFRGVIDHGEDGLLVPNRVEAWVNAINALAADSAWRNTQLEAARAKVYRLSNQALRGSEELW